MLQKIGIKIKKALKEADKTQEWLADEVEADRAQMSRWLNAQRPMPLTILPAVSRVLEIPTSSLFLDTEVLSTDEKELLELYRALEPEEKLATRNLIKHYKINQR